jgi:co-chaperonin GroES (HSP10)
MTDAPRFPRPLRNRVLVKELPWETTTASGLVHLPQTASQHEQNWRALVLAVGPGKAQPGLLKRMQGWLRRELTLNEKSGTNGSWSEGTALLEELDAGIERGFGTDVQPGDIIVVSRYVHTEVRVGEEICRIIGATDILAVLEPTEASEMRRWAQALLGRLAAPWNGEQSSEPTVRAARLEELTAE